MTNAKGREFENAIKDEVEKFWPGVTVDFVEGGKHPKAKFKFDGKIIARPFSGTSSDAIFGVHRMLGDMRRAMRSLGAERTKPDPTDAEVEKAYRKSNEGKAKRPDPVAREPVQPKAGLPEQVAAAHGLADFLFAGSETVEAQPGERESGNILSEKVARNLAITRPDIDLALRRITADPAVPQSGWGLYTDINAESYHLDPCPEPSISCSLMGPILDLTPADFAWKHPRRTELDERFPIDEDLRKLTVQMVRGDVVHQIALGKGRGYVIGQWDTWATKDAKAFKAEAEENGLVAIKQKDYEVAVVLAERIVESIKRALDGADYETEVVFMYQEQTPFGPVWVRGMMDVWCKERATILDPKVTPLLYDGKIERHALNMGWDRQAALYPYAIGKLFPELAGRVEFADVLINPEAPYVHRLWAPERAWVGSSLRQCLMAIERFGECMMSKRWHGFTNKVERGPMPAWEDKRRTEMEIGNR